MRRLLLIVVLASMAQGAETYLVAAGVEQYDDARIASRNQVAGVSGRAL